MDLKRFLDLYQAETRENLSLLGASLLALERDDPEHALDEAFRATHTIKGLAATMGYSGVAALAHALEDRLASARAARARPATTDVDRFLADSDQLEAAVAKALAAAKTSQADGATADAGAAPRHAIVRLRPDTPLPGARAIVVLKAARATGFVLEVEPAEPSDDFDGELRLWLAPGTDVVALEAAMRRAGDVDSVTFHATDVAPPAARRPDTALALAPGVRMDRARLDDLADRIGELSVLQARLKGDLERDARLEAEARIGMLLAELQHAVLALRMVPARLVFDRFPRLVRDSARALEKEIKLRIEGVDCELDRSILEELGEPLVHLIRNAVGHGIEAPHERLLAGKPPQGTLVLRAERERTSVLIEVADDGRGIDPARVAARAIEIGLLPRQPPGGLSPEDVFRLLSSPGFSTAERVTDLSGRGVGLDAVVTRIRALGGAIDMVSVPGEGTTFTLRLPITLALAQALRVRIGGEDYAIPLTHVAEAIDLDGFMLLPHNGREGVRLREDVLPLVRMRDVLGLPDAGAERAAVVAGIGERRAALAVDELVGREQILVKSFDPAVGTLPVFSGATLLADGSPALILDPLSVL